MHKAKSAVSQEIWKYKLDNIKHHQERMDKQEEYKFQMFKMKEEDVKLRYTNYNFQKQLVQTAKEYVPLINY